jgi:uncharacterized OB-fold protein
VEKPERDFSAAKQFYQTLKAAFHPVARCERCRAYYVSVVDWNAPCFECGGVVVPTEGDAA